MRGDKSKRGKNIRDNGRKAMQSRKLLFFYLTPLWRTAFPRLWAKFEGFVRISESSEKNFCGRFVRIEKGLSFAVREP